MRRFLWIPVSAALLTLVVWGSRPWEAADLLARLAPAPLVGAVLLNVPIIALWAIRSRRLMAGVGHPLWIGALVPVVSFANTVNNLTPASSGEVLRAVVLHRRHGVPYGASAAVILAERFWAIWIMAVTAVVAAAGPILRLAEPLPTLAWIAAIPACFLPSIAYALGLRPGRLLRRLGAGRESGRIARLGTRIAGVDDLLAGLLVEPRQALGFVLTTGAIFLCFSVQLVLVLDALGHPLDAGAAWAALGLATIAGVLSALPFGLGATDAVLTVLLAGSLGIPGAAAGATVLLLRTTTTLPLGIAGAASWAVLTGGRRIDLVPDEPAGGHRDG